MPAPVWNHIPQGHGWPAARGQAPLMPGQPPQSAAGAAGMGEWLDYSQVNPAAVHPYGQSMLTLDQMAQGAVSPWDPNLQTYGPMSGMGYFPGPYYPGGTAGLGADPAPMGPRFGGWGTKVVWAGIGLAIGWALFCGMKSGKKRR